MRQLGLLVAAVMAPLVAGLGCEIRLGSIPFDVGDICEWVFDGPYGQCVGTNLIECDRETNKVISVNCAATGRTCQGHGVSAACVFPLEPSRRCDGTEDGAGPYCATETMLVYCHDDGGVEELDCASLGGHCIDDGEARCTAAELTVGMECDATEDAHRAYCTERDAWIHCDGATSRVVEDTCLDGIGRCVGQGATAACAYPLVVAHDCNHLANPSEAFCDGSLLTYCDNDGEGQQRDCAADDCGGTCSAGDCICAEE